MASKKTSRGMSFPNTMWKDIEEQAKLLGYNENQFVERCVEAILEMIKSSQKQTVPKIVLMANVAKNCVTFPISIDATTQESVNEGEDLSDQEDEEAAA
ncbi:MAG: hypothetical protein R3F23_09225 [Verrucomicrobiia bacterium]